MLGVVVVRYRRLVGDGDVGADHSSAGGKEGGVLCGDGAVTWRGGQGSGSGSRDRGPSVAEVGDAGLLGHQGIDEVKVGLALLKDVNEKQRHSSQQLKVQNCRFKTEKGHVWIII